MSRSVKQDYDTPRGYQFALFRRTDSAESRPLDPAIARTREHAEEYMRLNYLPNVWASLEVRKRPAPGAWVKL